MSCIIKIQTGKYFCGWDMFGNMKFIDERRLAYRMKPTVAKTTAEKIKSNLRSSCEIIPA